MHLIIKSKIIPKCWYFVHHEFLLYFFFQILACNIFYLNNWAFWHLLNFVPEASVSLASPWSWPQAHLLFFTARLVFCKGSHLEGIWCLLFTCWCDLLCYSYIWSILEKGLSNWWAWITSLSLETGFPKTLCCLLSG